MKISKTCVTLGTPQLQVVVTISARKPWFAQAAASAPGTSRLIGSQNTENP